jgi:hypothetical protein
MRAAPAVSSFLTISARWLLISAWRRRICREAPESIRARAASAARSLSETLRPCTDTPTEAKFATEWHCLLPGADFAQKRMLELLASEYVSARENQNLLVGRTNTDLPCPASGGVARYHEARCPPTRQNRRSSLPLFRVNRRVLRGNSMVL